MPADSSGWFMAGQEGANFNVVRPVQSGSGFAKSVLEHVIIERSPVLVMATRSNTESRLRFEKFS